MISRHRTWAIGIAVLVWTAGPAPAQGRGQGAAPAGPPPPIERLPDGKPNLQGVWAAVLPGSLSLTNPVNQADSFEGTARRVPSRIIDPPDGLVPYQPWAAARQKQQAFDHDWPTRPEHIDTQHRCLLSGVPRLYTIVPPFKIVQTPGQVVFTWEQYHAYLVIPLDGRPHVPSSVTLWMGDGRGRWEGDTLVVDTTSVRGARLTYLGDFYSDNVHVLERFRLADRDNLVYEATMIDPTVFTRPWTIRVAHRRRPPDEFWESACYEGMVNPEEFLLKKAPPRPQ
ncbi:MAG: hypothetical protein A3F70_05380 [Acidobacteria bacterium RIFCSPLOWO2_12_FULL_67_14]|nr:MAG: hypothetical protein A3F70_05380 [Acidobacteria bacterium RIFCSPLOWO2_12_FULL_67_14]